MRESAIERHLRTRIHQLGGECIKLGQNGWPDDLVITAAGEVRFVETKATDGKVKPHQARRHTRLRRLGQEVLIPKSKEDVNEMFPDTR